MKALCTTCNSPTMMIASCPVRLPLVGEGCDAQTGIGVLDGVLQE